ncbi:MAG TPA: hypothetical protein VMY06_05125 [Sedimentisphaerales bacterium]|nr:hypothetical protein [Sedimentisphaerales bacterium]
MFSPLFEIPCRSISTAQSEGQGESEADAAENDVEGGGNKERSDAELSERDGSGEDDDSPSAYGCEHLGLRQIGVAGGGAHNPGDEVRKEHTDDQHKQCSNDAGYVGEQLLEDVRGLGQAEGVNDQDQHHHNDQPIDQRAEDLDGGSLKSAFAEDFRNAGLVRQLVEMGCLQCPADQPSERLGHRPAYDEDEQSAQKRGEITHYSGEHFTDGLNDKTLPF